MTTTTLSVPEIHCDHCKNAIEGAVGSLEGIRSAEVSIPGRTVTVDYDDAVVGIAQITEAIVEQGYDVPAPPAV